MIAELNVRHLSNEFTSATTAFRLYQSDFLISDLRGGTFDLSLLSKIVCCRCLWGKETWKSVRNVASEKGVAGKISEGSREDWKHATLLITRMQLLGNFRRESSGYCEFSHVAVLPEYRRRSSFRWWAVNELYEVFDWTRIAPSYAFLLLQQKIMIHTTITQITIAPTTYAKTDTALTGGRYDVSFRAPTDSPRNETI